MEKIVEWLINIERLAHTFYSEVSEKFKADKKISGFFRLLAVDEAWHCEVMEKALEHLGSGSNIAPFISLDSATREKIENTFAKDRELLLSGELDIEKLLGCLVTIEFSEWNDIFVYVVNSLRKENREFMRAAAKIQSHVREIEKFLRDFPEGQRHLHVIRCLPPVWHEKILIVEDDESVAGLLKAVLKHEGDVEIARNGLKALKKVGDGYFDVIISDIGMPGMDGIEFYKKAAEKEPGIGDRFLFITGLPADDYGPFFRQNKLRFLPKPVQIKGIKRNVDEILNRPVSDA